MLDAIVWTLLRLRYRPKIMLASLDRAMSTGERVILMPHYGSYLDPILFARLVPYRTMLLATPSMTRHALFRRMAPHIRHTRIDYADPFAVKTATDLWKDEQCLILFPEPEPTTNGILMKLHETAAAIAEKSGAWLVPARAAGSQFTAFSRLTGRHEAILPRRRSIGIELVSGEARRTDTRSGAAKERRGSVRMQAERLLRDTMMQTAWDKKPLFDSLLATRKLWGGAHTAAIEPDGRRVNWNGFITGILALRLATDRTTAPGERVGIMLPNSTAALSLLIALQTGEREPAMINYSMGLRGITAACCVAGVKQIITSRRFLEEGKFQPLADALSAAGIAVVHLEDLAGALTAAQKLSCALRARLAKPCPPREAEQKAARIAVVLFTSGSEGTPKPVALSHLNIQANTSQVRNTLDFTGRDVLFNIMPMFHSFGLCTGTLMPLNAGMPIAFYPTPLHYKKIPQHAYDTKATVILGTNAFLAGYAKNADNLDFFEMRYVICGGDKLQASTAKLWHERFGIDVLEGYGVTEASPVVGVNTRGRNRRGSIGRALPGVECHLAPVDGVAEGGRLVIKGPNIMTGYIMSDGHIAPPPENGYDTGDIVTIDEEGYIFIKGRAKRFAKIAGEMVSLAQVEDVAREIWPDVAHAVVAVADENRGEILVMLTEKPEPNREELMREMSSRGLPELAIPKKIIPLAALPKIGVGKTDYAEAARLAAEFLTR